MKFKYAVITKKGFVGTTGPVQKSSQAVTYIDSKDAQVLASEHGGYVAALIEGKEYSANQFLKGGQDAE